MMLTHGGSEPVLGAENAGWGVVAEMMREMMPHKFGTGQVFWQIHWALGFIIWILVIVLLIALIRWVWKKGDKVK